MAKNDIYIKIGVAAVFCVIVWCFWTLCFPYALGFNEQLQLFLFDNEFFVERLTMPAGIARYMAEFLVQLFYKPELGGAVIAAIFIALQLGIWQLVRRVCKPKLLAYVLSFIPSLLLWLHMGDVNVKLTFAVALLLALLAMVLYPQSKSKICKTLYLAIAVPALSWMAGPTVLVFMLYVAIREAISRAWVISVVTVIYTLFCLLVTRYLAPVPLYRLFYGVNYDILEVEFSVMQYVVMLAVALIPVILILLPSLKRKKELIIAPATTAALIVAFCLVEPLFFDAPTYEVIKYDYLARRQKWDDIIAAADKKTPQTPLTVAMLNLSLAMKGQLNERAMQYYQNGWEGAFPVFNKHYMVSLVSSEVYYYLGLVNSSQRMAFEAMEALPDNTKSVRCIKLLAETNLINGEYAVARKYLKLLENTLFYSKWATKTIELLSDEKAINDHNLYGHLRKLHLKNDFTFSEQEIDKIMGQLVMANHTNVLAVQYLLLLPQLEGNQQKYNAYREFVNNEIFK